MNKLIKAARSHEFIKALSSRSFLIFILSVIFSQIGYNMMNVVLIFLVYYLSRSSFFVSVLVLVAILPQIFLSFVGGVLADIKNKKVILIAGNMLRASIVSLLFFYSDSIPLIYIVALLISIITQFYVPAETPLIPKLVEKKYLISANAIFGMCLFGSILAGYVLAGPVVTILGRSNVFLFLAAAFLLASLCAIFIPTKDAKGIDPHFQHGTLRHNLHKVTIYEFKKSLKILRSATRASQAFMLLVFSQMVILILATIIPGYTESILRLRAENVSLILFAPAAFGMIISSLLVGSLFVNKNRDVLMNTGIFLSALVLCLFPFTPSFADAAEASGINSFLPFFLEITKTHIVVILAFIAGVANAFIFVPAQATIQENTPEGSRSKIYGLLFSVVGISSLIPIILAGGIADIFGVGAALVIVGILISLIGFARLGAFAFIKREQAI